MMVAGNGWASTVGHQKGSVDVNKFDIGHCHIHPASLDSMINMRLFKECAIYFNCSKEAP